MRADALNVIFNIRLFRGTLLAGLQINVYADVAPIVRTGVQIWAKRASSVSDFAVG